MVAGLEAHAPAGLTLTYALEMEYATDGDIVSFGSDDGPGSSKLVFGLRHGERTGMLTILRNDFTWHAHFGYCWRMYAMRASSVDVEVFLQAKKGR